jgi:hypothetical protein
MDINDIPTERPLVGQIWIRRITYIEEDTHMRQSDERLVYLGALVGGSPWEMYRFAHVVEEGMTKSGFVDVPFHNFPVEVYQGSGNLPHFDMIIYKRENETTQPESEGHIPGHGDSQV